MMRPECLPLSLLLLCSSFILSAAQDASVPRPSAPPVVTASARADGVRFAALGPVDRLRLEVYDRAGEAQLYDSGLLAGNVRDWPLVDRVGSRLPDGAYLYVVTARDAAGRLSLKQGVLIVEGGAASVSLGETSPAGRVVEEESPAAGGGASTLATHDGSDGAVTSTQGALTLRTGDLLSGRDQEHVRVTPDGRVGVGTTEPEATLDVAGDIRAAGSVRVAGGIRFADGTTLDAAGGRLALLSAEGDELPVPSNVTGTGATGRLTKWENGAVGQLSDSLLSEAGVTVTHHGNFFRMTGTPTSTVESNIIHIDSNTKTMGQVAGPNTFFGGQNGPYFILRGNAYSAIAGQRGLAIFSGGNVSSPTGREGSVQFNTLDTVRMLITPAGNVGLGLGNDGIPQHRLDVAGNINTSTEYRIGGQRAFISSVSSIAAIVFAGVGAGQNNTSDGTNNSFIGFRAGQNNTSGNANTFLGSVAGQNNTTGAFNVYLGRAAGTQNITGSRNTLIGANAAVGASNLTDATAIGANSRVDTSNSVVLGDLGAKVGIGTQAPTHRLTIGATETPVVASSLVGVYGAGAAYSIVRDTTNNVEALFGADVGGALYGSMTNHDVQFRINNSTRMRIFKDGGARINGGTLEIGTAGNDLSSLVVNGSIFVGTLGDEGEVSLCAGPINVVRRLSRCSSSIRYKTAVRDFTAGLDLLNRLRPVSFRWRKSGNGDLGFVAEEVAAAEPLLATRNERGEVEGVKYDRITAVLVNAVREQQQLIEGQQGRIEELEKAFRELAARRKRAARGRR